MPALVVGGVTITGAFAAPRTVVEAIDRERAMDNTLLATQLGVSKNEWAISVRHRTVAQLAVIEAALAGTPPITCSGDVLGGSVSCHVQVHGSEPVLGTSPKLFNLNFSLLQV